MEAPLIGPAAEPRVCNGEETGEEVGRRGEEESLDLSEAEGLDNGWEEVCGSRALAMNI